jgi:hypothetical protein
MRQRTLIITLAIIILLFVIYKYMKSNIADNSGCQPDAQEKANMKNCDCIGVANTVSPTERFSPEGTPPPPSGGGIDPFLYQCSAPVENPCPCTRPNNQWQDFPQ